MSSSQAARELSIKICWLVRPLGGIFELIAAHEFSMGFKSGPCVGHWSTLIDSFSKYCLVIPAVCFGSLSCLNVYWPVIRNFFNRLRYICAENPNILPSSHNAIDLVHVANTSQRKITPGHDGVAAEFHSFCCMSIQYRFPHFSPHLTTFFHVNQLPHWQIKSSGWDWPKNT